VRDIRSAGSFPGMICVELVRKHKRRFKPAESDCRSFSTLLFCLQRLLLLRGITG
jgi:hypothetical protein